MPESQFQSDGNEPQGRWVGLAFFVPGLVLLILAGAFAMQTSLWLAARERIEGTVIAVERGGHAVVEGQAADGHIVRAVDDTSIRPPPLVGTPRTLAVRPGSRYGATVVGFMNTWFFPVLFGAIGAPFAILGLLALILGSRGRMVRSPNTGPSWDAAPRTGDDGSTTVINNYYGDDGTYQA